jgi:GTP-binding protein
MCWKLSPQIASIIHDSRFMIYELCCMNIVKAEYVISSPDYTKCPAPDRPEYAFIGRSNVGKSSLINMLTNKQKLAKTSHTPGKTQLINHFEIISTPDKESVPATYWYLSDLPGYGYAKVSHRQRNNFQGMIEHYLRLRTNLQQVFVLIDSRHEPQKIDLDFLHDLGQWQTPFSLVFTKSDKENQSVVAKNVNGFLNKLKATWQFLPRHFVTSAIKGIGRDKILALIEELNENSKQAGNGQQA